MNPQLSLLALTVFTIVGYGIAALAPRSMTHNEQGAEPQEKTAEQVYRSIQVFKGLPASQVYPAMNFISGALGVACTHCHVPNQFERDEKAAKQTARRMIEMTRTLNRSSFGDAPAVTCYTCHRGQSRPLSVPALTLAAVTLPRASETVPTVDQLLDRFITALGGKSKLEQITTLTMKGTETPSGAPASPPVRVLEAYRKAPNKLLLVNTVQGNNSVRGFDGETGWQQFSGRTMGMSATDLGMIRREAQLDRNYNLRTQYTEMTVTGLARLGEREVWVIEATPVERGIGPMGVKREWLYFDKRTGLLARRLVEAETVLGRIPFATDFDDYRDVDSLKWPFTVHQLLPNFVVTQRFTDVKLNVELSDERFRRPATHR